MNIPFDDFVSVPVADPELEAIRRKYENVVLATTDVFVDALSSAIAELKASEPEIRAGKLTNAMGRTADSER